MKGLIKTPTPDTNSKPASVEGTSNNAEVWLPPFTYRDNFVKSYLTKDLVTGQNLVVNFAGKDDGSLFGPGYVVRFVKDGYAHTAGEGLDWAQSDIGGTTIQWIGNQIIWGMQMSDIISDVKDKANTQCGC